MGVNERLKEIDIVRGITIFLVVLGHTGVTEVSEGLVAEIFREFRMPLFFMVSGYLFSTTKYLDNIKNLFTDKARTLLIPYFSFCLMSAGIWFLYLIISKQNVVWWEPFIGMLYGNGNWIVENTPIWFLVSLFCAFIVFNLILKFSKKLSLLSKTTVFVIVGILGYGISRIVWLPWSLDIALVALLFMFIGSVLKEKRVLYNHKTMITLFVISVFIFITVLYFNVPVDMNNRVYGNLFLFYMGGISGGFLILFISKYLFTKIKFIYSIFSYMGRESIIILGFHFSVGFMIADWLAAVVGMGGALFTTVIAISSSLLLGMLINKIPIFLFLFKGTSLPVRKASSIKSEGILEQAK